MKLVGVCVESVRLVVIEYYQNQFNLIILPLPVCLFLTSLCRFFVINISWSNSFPTGPKSIWIMGKQCVCSQDKTSKKQGMLFVFIYLFLVQSVCTTHAVYCRKNKEEICEHALSQSHTLSLKISWLEVIAIPKRGVWISPPDLPLLGGGRGRYSGWALTGPDKGRWKESEAEMVRGSERGCR